jgi:hypothetical protein
MDPEPHWSNQIQYNSTGCKILSRNSKYNLTWHKYEIWVTQNFKLTRTETKDVQFESSPT